MLTTACKSIHQKSQVGFSYLWTLLLVALMGIGLTVAAELDATISQRDREKALLSIGRQFQSAIGSYYESQQAGGKKEYPSSFEDLLRDPRYPGIKRHLRKVYIDPMTGKPDWGVTRIGGRIVAVYSRSDKKPIKQAGFEEGFRHFENGQKYSDWVFSYPSSLIIRQDDITAAKMILQPPATEEIVP